MAISRSCSGLLLCHRECKCNALKEFYVFVLLKLGGIISVLKRFGDQCSWVAMMLLSFPHLADMSALSLHLLHCEQCSPPFIQLKSHRNLYTAQVQWIVKLDLSEQLLTYWHYDQPTELFAN